MSTGHPTHSDRPGDQLRNRDAELEKHLVHGRQSVFVEVVAYDPRWPQQYARERMRIEAAFGASTLAVHHVGSTSVPGLAAKAVLDICVEVADPEDDAMYLPRLADAGYDLRVVEPGHRCLRREKPAVNLHVYAGGAHEVRRYLLLRNRLRHSDSDRALYEQTKRALAGRQWPDMNYYADAKGPVIREILGRATDATP